MILPKKHHTPLNTALVMTGRLGTRDQIEDDQSSGGKSRPAVVRGGN
jgi:hypothetical protein